MYMKFDVSRFDRTLKGFTSSTGSFPIGGGDCGANVWVSVDGKLNLLLSKTDCYSEAARLMKLGYLQFDFENPVFTENNLPLATLHLENGSVVVTDENDTVRITVCAFVDKPLYGVDVTFSSPNAVRVSLVNYRDKKRRLDKGDDSARTCAPAPYDVYESADVIRAEDRRLSWYHHNGWSYYENTLKNQHLDALTGRDPILHRIFGCSVGGKNFRTDGHTLRSESSGHHTVFIAAGCEMTDESEKWSEKQGSDLLDSLDSLDFDALKEENAKWWGNYFSEYYLDISGDEDAEAVTRGYTVQKYLLGCCSRGKLPVKFNGAIFTVEPSPHYEGDYDYRRWGGAFWLQNTRLIYWDLLYSGYFEGLLPFFDWILDIVPECRERCRVLFGHKGLLLPETTTFFGTYEDFDFGYGQEDSESPAPENNYIRWHYNGALEVCYMMLKFREFTGDKYAAYFEEKLLPFIGEVLLFFREHFPKVNGKMRLYPVSSLETWQDCVDDTPDIAGLLAIVRELKKIGVQPCLDESDIPPLPLAEKDGKTVIAPCRETFRPYQQNIEDPELYPLFPFEIYRYDMSPEDKKLLSDTFATVPNRNVFGWSQMNIWAAMLGDAGFCRKNITENFKAKNKDYFFDAYFGPNYDWTPDQDHGCSTSIAAIFTVLQSYGDKVFIKPALPAEWEVRFRLPTPRGVREYGAEKC